MKKINIYSYICKIIFNTYTMTTEMKKGYESPCCLGIEITSEGLLCASFLGINKEFDYIFGEDEE